MDHHYAATSFEHSTTINVPIEQVWNSLTDIEQMKAWMGEPEMRLEIDTDSGISSSIVVSGMHHASFKNTGMVLAFEPKACLTYTFELVICYLRNHRATRLWNFG